MTTNSIAWHRSTTDKKRFLTGEAYSAQRVVNSRWLKEVESINSVYPMYRPESWRDRQHFIFWFHDSTFERLALSYKVETYRASMKKLLGLMVEGLISQG